MLDLAGKPVGGWRAQTRNLGVRFGKVGAQIPVGPEEFELDTQRA